MHDPVAKGLITEIADDFDELAKRNEERANDTSRQAQ
jgi:hypothetical protein